MNSRKITVFSTKGKKRQTIESGADTWGQLKEDLLKEGVDTQGLKSIIGETQLSLESSKAVLPDYDFVLFLSPVKVKSGSCEGCGTVDPETMGYKECKSFIKDAIAESTEAKEHFGNYTIMSTTQMRALIETWLENNSEELSVEDATVVELIDHVIDMLEVLKEKVESGTVEPDDTAKFEAMWKDIENNL
jgi:hypothetical protein